mgnify:CR=1 FL=1
MWILNQAAAAREVFGRQPAHIALVHGTPIAADAYAEVLAAYAAAGVQFVTLEEAMSDPANQIVPPTVTRYFRNSTQKWAEHAGIGVADLFADAVTRAAARTTAPPGSDR